MGCQFSPRVTSLPRISTSSYLESKRRWSSGCSSVITTVATAPATPARKLVCRICQACQGFCAATTDPDDASIADLPRDEVAWPNPGELAARDEVELGEDLVPGPDPLHRPRNSEHRTYDEHSAARDEMLQVVRQLLDPFAPLLLKALHFDDLRDQHVIGLTNRLSGHVRGPRKAPIRHRVQRTTDDVPIPRHQTLKVLGQLRRAQLKPHQKGRGRAHPRSVVHIASGSHAAPGSPHEF